MTQSPTPDAFDSARFLAGLTQQPGIYQMFDAGGAILYIGKAKNLKARVSSYFRQSGLSPKTAALVAKIAHIEVTITASETEALILEQSLIKASRPPYNILLRDDKSYPFIFVSSGEDFPRISFHRGAKKRRGDYYGPYPNGSAVRESLSFLQKTFRVRQCEDSVYRNRSRPCLQYQIKRCTAPCVGFVSKEEYENDLRHTRMYLIGKGDELMDELADQMETAAAAMDYEKAAVFRDQIAALRNIQAQQVIEEGSADVDVVAAIMEGGASCVHVLFVRQGRILGSRSYYPQSTLAETAAEVLEEFLPGFYLADQGREIPGQVITNHPLRGGELLNAALQRARGRQLQLTSRVRSHRARWLEMAEDAARQNLKARLSNRQSGLDRTLALQDALGLEEPPRRLECFDISHTGGELTQASCVVFDSGGPLKSDYRRFNIEGITPGDDYAAMAQALQRRYTRLQKGEGKLPDVLLIDGGKGQLTKAEAVLAELGVQGVELLAVAKGATRKAGFEHLYRSATGEEITLTRESPALHLIQHIRDEAHRFAVTGHKQRRDKRRKTSGLEDVPGIGAARRRELLRHFGGMQEVKRASRQDLARVPGISRRLADELYGFFHNE